MLLQDKPRLMLHGKEKSVSQVVKNASHHKQQQQQRKKTKTQRKKGRIDGRIKNLTIRNTRVKAREPCKILQSEQTTNISDVSINNQSRLKLKFMLIETFIGAKSSSN